jgi:hypothetical protein
MNKILKSRVFDIPQNILDLINHTITGLNGQHYHGVNRAKKLLTDKKVKYGQLKRIIHDLKNIDKINDKLKYDLCGGDLMNNWANQFLDGERDLIKNNKNSQKNANEMGGIDGDRKNPFLKKHTKKQSWIPSANLIKSNSNKTSVSPLISMKLFEEIERIKTLM